MIGGEDRRFAGDGGAAVFTLVVLEQHYAVPVRVLEPQAGPVQRDLDLLELHTPLAERLRRAGDGDAGLKLPRHMLEPGLGPAGRNELQRVVLVRAPQQGARSVALPGQAMKERPARERLVDVGHAQRGVVQAQDHDPPPSYSAVRSQTVLTSQ